MDIEAQSWIMQPRPGGRVFRDAEWQWWRVHETPAERHGSVMRPRTLVFESSRFARRVREFPDDWQLLEDDALERLSWHR